MNFITDNAIYILFFLASNIYFIDIIKMKKLMANRKDRQSTHLNIYGIEAQGSKPFMWCDK